MRQQLKNIFGPLTQPGIRWLIPVLILMTAALSLFILHVDIKSYKQYTETVPMHQKVDVLSTLHAEKMNAIFNGESIENFNFTFHGIDTFIVPPPISIFDLSSHYGAITRGKIHAGGHIEIDDVIINIFRLHHGGLIDTFTGAIFIMGGFIFLIVGFSVFYLKENAAFLEAGKLKATFFSKAAAAFLTVIILDGIFMGSGLIFSHYKGLTFPIDAGILHIYLLFVLIHCLAVCIGALFGSAWPYINQITWKGATILILIMVLLGASVVYVDSICNKKEDKIRHVVNEGELEQMTIFNKMYGQLYDLGEKFGRGDVKTKQVQDIVLNYLNNEYPKVEALETQMIEAKKDHYATSIRYNKFFPLSFFGQMFYEIAGFGGNSNLNFHIYLRDKNRRYLKSIIDNAYFSDEKAGKTYYKDNEPLYYTHGNIPGTIYQGVGICLLYILILLTIVYFRLRIIVPRESARIDLKKERDVEVGNETTGIETKSGVKVRR